MRVATVVITLRDGRVLRWECPLDHATVRALQSNDLEVRANAERSLMVRRLSPEQRGHLDLKTINEQMVGWRVELLSQAARERDLERALDLLAPDELNEVRRRREIARCRSLLELANRILPPGVREDALDEWMDDIECAAAERKPVFRRTLSILCRSLPRLAIRSRRPARARGNGG